jgi:hypothetical protein
MSKHKQRKASSYDIGQKIGAKIAEAGTLERSFNQHFKRMYRGSRKFYAYAYSGAKHGYQNALIAKVEKAQLSQLETELTR